jgi:hypothetical protein
MLVDMKNDEAKFQEEMALLNLQKQEIMAKSRKQRQIQEEKAWKQIDVMTD